MRVLVCLAALTATMPPKATAQGGRADRAARLRAMGQAYLAAGDPGSAVGYFRDAIGVNSADAAAYESLGGIYLDRRAIADALDVYAAGLRRRPDHAGLWLGRARALELRGDARGAAEALRRLLRQAPDHVHAHRARAELARRRGAFGEALASYRAIVDLAARGRAVDGALVEEARRYAAALELLTRGMDPARPDCDGASPVRRALAGC